MKKHLPHLLCLGSGIAVGLCLLFPAFGPAIFFAMTPALSILLRQTEAKQTLKYTVIFCMSIYLVVYLLAFSIRPNVDESAIFWIDLAVYIVCTLVHGLLFAVCLWLGLRYPCRKPLRCLAVVFFWILAEWLCTITPFAWPIMQLSLTLRNYPILIQTASWGGTLLVSAFIIAVNFMLATILLHWKTHRMLYPIVSVAALLIITLGAGICAKPQSVQNIAIAIIQPGMSTIKDERVDIYMESLRMAKEAVQQNPDSILLPESVIPGNWGDDKMIQNEWGQIAQTSGADVLVGGSKDRRAAVYHFSPNGTLKDVYQKKREVPFFENGVGDKSFKWTMDKESSQLSLKQGTAGVMICYESMFSSMARNKALANAEFLIVATNDSWFDSKISKDLHLGHSIFRAVETGRTLVQAGLDGYTAVINEQGYITNIADAYTSQILYTEISTANHETIYMKWGNSWMLLCIVILTVGININNNKREMN